MLSDFSASVSLSFDKSKGNIWQCGRYDTQQVQRQVAVDNARSLWMMWLGSCRQSQAQTKQPNNAEMQENVSPSLGARIYFSKASSFQVMPEDLLAGE